MFEKRKDRLTRLAQEIEKRRQAAAEGRDFEEKPRRVNNTDLFLKIRAMQEKGARNDPGFRPSSVPLC